MDYQFWDNCWAKDEQPFHIDAVHPFLAKYLNKEFSKSSPILVPLSGKSLDLIYFSKKGFNPIGVEFNPQAINEFLQENKFSPVVEKHKDLTLYQIGKIDLWLADFFKITKENLGNVSQVYDRAALIALPPEMQQLYVDHLLSLIDKPATVLLMTLEYPQSQMTGPPFYIDLTRLKKYFLTDDIVEIDRISFFDNHSRWKELQLEYLDEVLYKINLI